MFAFDILQVFSGCIVAHLHLLGYGSDEGNVLLASDTVQLVRYTDTHRRITCYTIETTCRFESPFGPFFAMFCIVRCRYGFSLSRSIMQRGRLTTQQIKLSKGSCTFHQNSTIWLSEKKKKISALRHVSGMADQYGWLGYWKWCWCCWHSVPTDFGVSLVFCAVSTVCPFSRGKADRAWVWPLSSSTQYKHKMSGVIPPPLPSRCGA
jgi:hypothetical protein